MNNLHAKTKLLINSGFHKIQNQSFFLLTLQKPIIFIKNLQKTNILRKNMQKSMRFIYIHRQCNKVYTHPKTKIHCHIN